MKFLSSKEIKKTALVLLLFLFVGCGDHSKVIIEQLEGYWEIDSVEQEGEVFKSNQKTPLYDYYFLDKNKGFYKKVAPLLYGNFQTSESSIAFEVREEKGIFKLYFTSPWSSWQKTIQTLNAEQLVLFHEGRNFNYKRVNPNNAINKNESGEE